MDAAPGRVPRPMLWAALALALTLHLGLLAAGFQRLSNDEAVRVLLALSLTAENALDPWIWPPLHRWVLGLALKLYEDPVWVPRLLSIAAALGLMAAVLRLAARVSGGDARVVLAAALLALVTPYRLLLGTVPMADIFMLLLLVAGAERVLAWLQEGRTRALLAGCALVGLATAVRYEAWFVAVTLGGALAWRWWRGQGVRFGTLAAAGALLSWFPLFWIADSRIWYGSLGNLAITPEQFKAIAGDDAGRLALLLNPLGQPLWQELAWNPATWLGAAMLARLARRDAALRGFAAGFMAALPLMGATMLAATAVSLAATWRLVGAWSLLLLPFGALALVRLAEWVAARLRAAGATVPGAAAALTALLLPTVALPAARDLRLARAEMYNWATGTWRHDAEAGRAALAELERLGGGRVVVDSLGNLDFLEVMVGSGAPRLFVTSADAAAPAVGLHVPMARHLREIGDTARLELYLADRFDLAAGGDPAALAARGIRLALVRDAGVRAALDASPDAELAGVWPDWALYRLRPTLVHGSGSSPS
jgi:hypothetical protein